MQSNNRTLIIVLLVATILLLLINIYNFTYDNDDLKSFLFRIGSNILVILAFIFRLISIRKEQQKIITTEEINTDVKK